MRYSLGAYRLACVDSLEARCKTDARVRAIDAAARDRQPVENRAKPFAGSAADLPEGPRPSGLRGTGSHVSLTKTQRDTLKTTHPQQLACHGPRLFGRDPGSLATRARPPPRDRATPKGSRLLFRQFGG
jgi:hypothetical protein